MDTGARGARARARITEADCRVASNLSKQCVWSPGGAAALAPLSSRVALRGTPNAPPTMGHERADGGMLLGIKVLGAFLGDVGWCSAQLVKRVRRTMPPSMTIEAAQEHGRLIASAFHRIVGSEAGSPAQCERALRQARLPVKLGAGSASPQWR